MATITTINATDNITDSRAVINTNFANLNSDKIETSYLDTDTTLAANSDVKIPTQKAVKAYVDSGGNVNASSTQKGIVEEATDAEVVARTATGATGARLYVNPASLSSLVKQGGTGADGALAITTGTTTIDCAGAAIVVKNYTSISISGDGKLAFSNPHANGTAVFLKSQGGTTLTSSQAPMIDCSGLGADKETVGYGAGLFYTNKGANGTSGAIGAGGAVPTTPYINPNVAKIYTGKYPYLFVGGGGGKGGVSGDGVAGDGGRGGGALIIECGGAFNFTTTGGISVAGANGAAGAEGAGGNDGSGGGGGGGGGFCGIFYNTLIANTGTITVAGGTGGNAHVRGAFTAYGGGGGASASTAGNPGTSTGSDGSKTGGDGGAGFSLVAQNSEFV